MLFIANTLPMNGGSTFLIRACRELIERGTRPGVLILFDKNDPSLVEELHKYADVYFLSDFSYFIFRFLYGSQLGLFFPFRRSDFYNKIKEYQHVHVMGVFGFLFFLRFFNLSFFKEKRYKVKLTVGVYHQNEFMYSSPSFYFSKYVRKSFESLDPRSIVFFNENSVINYSNFFNINYMLEYVLPIGVSIPLNKPCLGSADSRRIVSVGQLYDFKTYNKHVIECMPVLLEIDNSIVYEIYGDGSESENLKKLAKNLGVQSSVVFKGVINYSEIADVLNDCLVFVGSGTAIIEASMHGIPSVIGIESCKEPVTYGFFSNAQGFSYHEYVPGKERYFLKDILTSIISDKNTWKKESVACKEKTLEFSVEKTIDGFLAIPERVGFYKTENIYSNSKALLSFLFCAALDVLKINKEFSSRRNQGCK